MRTMITAHQRTSCSKKVKALCKEMWFGSALCIVFVSIVILMLRFRFFGYRMAKLVW